MLSRHLKPSLFIFVFLLGLRTAHAYSCGGSGTVLEAYDYADVVVTVSVASVEKAEPGNHYSASGDSSDNEPLWD